MTAKRRSKEDQERLDRLKSAMLRDVASRGLSNADLAAMELHTEAREGKIQAYLYKVDLNDGTQLTYKVTREGVVSVNGVTLGDA